MELDVVKQLLGGALVSGKIFIIVFLFSLPLGFLLTEVRKIKVFRIIIDIYVSIMRGTPLMLQLFFMFYAIPFIPGIGQYFYIKDRFICACLTFIINYTAYFLEIFRGGFMAVPEGQYRAALVLGYSKAQCLGKIILPQVLKVTLPAIANEAVTLVKDTSLVFTIGIVELLTITKTVVNQTVNVTPYLITGAIYYAASWVLVLFFRYLEKQLNFQT